MMSEGQLLIWLHVLAWAAYFGAQWCAVYMLLPAAERAPDESNRRATLIAGFRFYNPFTIATLGIVVITGAMRLTDLKAEMKADYFAKIGEPLALKLALAFLVIFIQTYITFGLAFRIGRQEEVAAHGDGPRFTTEQLDSILKRIRAMVWVTIVLTALTVLVLLTIVRRAGGDDVMHVSPARAALVGRNLFRHSSQPAARAMRGRSGQARAISELTR
jgi:uncharacterized membrane protein